MLEKRKKKVSNNSKVKRMIKQTWLQLVAPTHWVTWQHSRLYSSVMTCNYMQWKVFLSTKLIAKIKSSAVTRGQHLCANKIPSSAQATPHARINGFFRQRSSCTLL